MPMASPGGPRWIRKQYVAREKRRRGFGPIRDFLARLFGRPRCTGGSVDGSAAVYRPNKTLQIEEQER